MKIGMVSLGCPKNLVDAEVMIGLLERAGHVVTTDPGDAEVLVVNTCAFIDGAKRESVEAILDMARHKETGHCRQLVVTGCLAERYRETLRDEIPEIDVVLGTNDVPAVVSAVAAGTRGGSPVRLYRRSDAGEAVALATPAAAPPVASRPTYLYDADTPRRLATPPHLAYIKIAEGCDYACAFCIIPTLRGPYRSRPIASIVTEARALAERGVREVNLISQDTTFYGVDRGDRHALATLLGELDAIPALDWIRLLYLYPTTLRDETIDAIARLEKVCRYVDLPLQHASDPVLKRMRRPGTRAGYERLISRLRARVPGVTLRTTFIVGFPGETERDFETLCAFVDAVEFDHVGVFTYSHEEGTAAFALADDVPARVKRERRRHLMARQRRIVARAHRRRRGRVERLLVDGPAPDHPLVTQARLEGQAHEVDPVVYLTDCEAGALAAGSLIPARIVGARGYDLVARPLPGSGTA